MTKKEKEKKVKLWTIVLKPPRRWVLKLRDLETNPSMEVSCQFNSFKEDNGESGDSDPEYDSDEDPSYSILEETHAKFSNLSIEKKKKSKARLESHLLHFLFIYFMLMGF